MDVTSILALCILCSNPNDNYLQQNLSPNLIQLDNNNNGATMPASPADNEGSQDIPAETLVELKETWDRLNWTKEYLNGKHLRIATLEDYPLSYTNTSINGTIHGWGVAFELIDFLKEKFNFTYEVILPEKNIIGSKNDYDGSLMELLHKNKTDLAAAFIPQLAEQRTYFYYSTTTLDEGEWIMVMQRPSESASGSGLLAPFDFWVWIIILVSLLAVGPIIYCLIIVRNKLTGDSEQKPYSLSHCAWFVYGALMKQGSTLSPIADSTRLLFATWWIFITILTSFYTANLTAFLTLSKFTLPFNTVNDILVKNKHFVTKAGNGVEYSITTVNESLYNLNSMINKKLAKFQYETNDTLTLREDVEKLGNVFIRDRPAITRALYLDYQYRKTINMNDEKIHCPFAQAKEPFLTKKRSFAYPMSTNISVLIDKELLNLVESGIIKHLSAKDLPNAEICPQDLGGTERQLRNGDLMMTYYIMFAGFATSIVVFTTEILFRYLNSRQDNSRWANQGVGRTPDGHQFKPILKWFWQRGNKERSSASSQRELLDNSNKRRRPLHSNTTPPPPYQSIYSNRTGNANTNIRRWHQAANGLDVDSGASGGFGALRPIAQYGQEGVPSLAGGVRRFINGREYMVYRTPDGFNQLVPVRVPSAALFQYTYTE